jgi:hypothetical protein
MRTNEDEWRRQLARISANERKQANLLIEVKNIRIPIAVINLVF